MTRKSPDPVDVHVGSRVRLRRMLIGMSQEKLGEALDLTFQQVQKYEKGANRIGAGRLYRIAQLLGVPVQFFFDDAPGEAASVRGFSESDPAPMVMDFMHTAESVHLNRAFAGIKDPMVRKRLIDLARAVAGQDGQADA
ncbi:MAG: helix-turn-helix domain-containing protein [Pseudomonadota bacterium]|jgi:transcriptional regulator with XRE-family HTH domain|nr:transcriptional regulator [Alphaproteobacteria bacterium]